jgi:proteasome accessory factor C
VSGSSEQLERLLALLPYVIAHPGVKVAELARAFAVSEEQVRKDLQLAFVCGLPGYTPGDLIEVWFEPDGTVSVTNADTVRRPLRLTRDEALALIVALRTLADIPGADSDAVRRALAKIEAAAGEAAEPTSRVAVAVEGEPEVVAALTEAIESGRRVHLSYWVPARDETTERDVDPLRILVAEGRTYLWGWCRTAEDLRTFRTDRVVSVRVLDVPADPPREARDRPLPESLFTPAAADLKVRLLLAPSARWVADYYPCESVTETGDGGLAVQLRSRDTAWLVRLVLRLGGAATVAAPEEVAQAVRDEAALTLAAY